MLNRKIQAVSESLELMGMKLLSSCVKAVQTEEYVDAMADLTRHEALKRNEIFIARKMNKIISEGVTS